MNWILMPVVDCWEYTGPAIRDCLAQDGVDPHVLVINNGSSDETRDHLEQWAERDPRLHIWHHDPPLPSLAATWNLALRFVWAAGETEALVVNNDVRLHKDMYQMLLWVQAHEAAYFVSGVGVRPEQFDPTADYAQLPLGEPGTVDAEGAQRIRRGGPDFSCFLISREGHERYPFDENFQPAYHEDNDLHRRMLLAGDGSKIFGVNLPFLHYGSRTINRSPEVAQRFSKGFAHSRAYYQRKWGGGIGSETYRVPFDQDSVEDGITTPELFAACREVG